MGTIMSELVKRRHGAYVTRQSGRAHSAERIITPSSDPTRGRSTVIVSTDVLGHLRGCSTIAGGVRYYPPTVPCTLHRPGGVPSTLPGALRCDVVRRGQAYAHVWRNCRLLANLEKRSADTWAARFALLDTR